MKNPHFPLHFADVTGTALPPDYISPPDDAKGNPTLKATLFCPVLVNHPAKYADEVDVHRAYKGAPWVCSRRTFVKSVS